MTRKKIISDISLCDSAKLVFQLIKQKWIVIKRQIFDRFGICAIFTRIRRNRRKFRLNLLGIWIMALTVPPPPTTSFSEFGWIFHNNHLDSSIYQDDDIMEFSDSSAEYQTPPHQNNQQQQQQQQVSVCKSSTLFTRNKKNTIKPTHVMLAPFYFHLMMSVSSSSEGLFIGILISSSWAFEEIGFNRWTHFHSNKCINSSVT